MKKLAGIFSGLVALALIGGIVAVRWFYHEVERPGPLAENKLVYIAPGTATRGISAKLTAEGVLRDALPFLIETRLKAGAKGLKAGEFEFPAGVTVAQAVALLQSGKTHQRQITIPEGLLSLEIVTLLKAEESLTGDIENMPADGTLLPETYNYSYGDARGDLVRRMQKAMGEAVDAAWEQRTESMRLTKEEAVVLASIVEKETGVGAERPRVAGVFFNRLHRGMPLQSDPTVIYAVTLGQSVFDRPITVTDLKTPSPFNTYIASGLPPAPIANPGRAALAAVMNPEKNDFIYFCADGTGGHAFAKTLQEHNRNVAKWRAIEKAAKKP